MTIDDQIRDEKLQFDINRKAAIISALSSGEIRKYEYLTGEEILLSKRQRIIEQAKFTYSPLGKAFGKQTKTIEDRGKKQVEALKDLRNNKKNPQIHNTDDYKNELLISKEREIFKNIYNERLDKIEELTKRIDHNDLNFIVNSTDSETDFSGTEDPITFLDNIKTNKITMEQAKASQEDFNNFLKTIRRGNKTEEQKNPLKNINMLFNGRNDVIKFIEDYASVVLEANKKLLKNQQQVKDLKY